MVSYRKMMEKSKKATQRHLDNIEKLSKMSEKEQKKVDLNEMYGYLDYCWICDKPIRLWDRLTFNVVHSFEGNSHRRKCYDD